MAAGLMRDLTAWPKRGLGQAREPAEPSGKLHARRQDLLRAGQHPLVAVAVWLSNKAFADAGVPVPTNWDEFVAAAPALEAKGIIPLAMGQQSWQTAGAIQRADGRRGRTRGYLKVYKDKDAEVAAGPDIAKVFKAVGRRAPRWPRIPRCRTGTRPPTSSSPARRAGRSWATGRRANPGRRPGRGQGLHCLPGLGVNEVISTGGDAFYFPVLSDPRSPRRKRCWLSVMMAPATQVAFNLKKGFAAGARRCRSRHRHNDCMMKKGWRSWRRAT